MSHQFFGVLSGALVAGSAIPYLYRVHHGKIKPQLSSWYLWTFIGFAILVTYATQSLDWSVVPAVFGFVNPASVVAFTLRRRAKRIQKIRFARRHDLLQRLRRKTSFKWYERLCLAAGIASLLLWVWVRYQGTSEQSPIALYTAIFADICAVVPTMLFVIKHPKEERPLPWLMFSVGYACVLPAVSSPGWEYYVLPLYMTFGTFLISMPLVKDYIRTREPLREWI